MVKEDKMGRVGNSLYSMGHQPPLLINCYLIGAAGGLLFCLQRASHSPFEMASSTYCLKGNCVFDPFHSLTVSILDGLCPNPGKLVFSPHLGNSGPALFLTSLDDQISTTSWYIFVFVLFYLLRLAQLIVYI